MLIVSNWLKVFRCGGKAAATMAFALVLPVAQAQRSLSPPEKIWVVFHPFSAMKVRRIGHECDKIYDQQDKRSRLDLYSAGGKLDAWRHVFYMAAFAQRVKAKKIRKLGKAHEKGNYRQFRKERLEEGERPDSLSCEMDLLNNELGIAIGCNNRDLPIESLADMTIHAVNHGKAWIFLRDSTGAYLTCDGERVDISQFSGKWYVPKCLIRSDGTHSR